jgi:short-subunit dehydrogenase
MAIAGLILFFQISQQYLTKIKKLIATTAMIEVSLTEILFARYAYRRCGMVINLPSAKCIFSLDAPFNDMKSAPGASRKFTKR